MNPWEMDWSGSGVSSASPPTGPSQPAPWEMDWSNPPAPHSGIWNNATAGLNEAIDATLGAPVDLATGALNLAARQARVISGAPVREIENPVGGSRSIAGALEGLGVNDPAKVHAGTNEERLARATGAGVAGMVAPEAVIGALGKAGMLSEGVLSALAPIFGRSGSVGDVATAAGIGAAAGLGGQTVGDALPEKFRPLGEMAGNLLGGAVGAGAVAAGRGLAQVPTAWRDFRLSDPETQEATAGDRLRRWATDPYAVRDALDQPTELVPGSRPTTFQATGDMGLGALERASAAQHPAEFMQRRADQNAARIGALEGIQPDGAPEQVVQALRRGLSDLDRVTAQAEDAAASQARNAASALGGEGTAEGYGASIRQSIMDARGIAKERERALWQAVDPDGTLNLPATGVRDTARSIVQGLEKSAAPLAGEERAAIVTAMRYPDVVPFKEMTALRSRVSDALRQELSTNGQTRVYARLSQLRGAIERDIENAVSAKAAMEEQAVQAGAMRAEDTIAAMMARWEQERGAWYGQRSAAEIGRSVSEGSGGHAAFGSGRIYPAHGTEGQGGSRPYNPPGDQGIQGPGVFPPDLQANFDEVAASRLKAASEATKQRAETFDAGRVGTVTRRSGAQGPFQMESAVVPLRFFAAGPRGYEAMQALRDAAPQAIAQVRDYAISSLKNAAERPDGVLDPARVQAWRQKHADALRALPEVDRMLADPVAASETLARISAQRREQLDAFQQGAVARLLGLEDPADVTRTIGGIFARQDQVQQMSRLVRETAGSEEARQGLRKAVADFITTRFISNTEAATSGQDLVRSDAFQQFLRQSGPALQKVLSVPEMMTLHAIAADLKRANRSIAAVRLPGGSNTTQDMMGTAKASGVQSWLSRILSPGALASAGAAAGSTMGGAVGAAAGGAGGAHFGRVIDAMRQAGLASVDDIVKDAMLNPERARALLAKVSAEPTEQEAVSLVGLYMRALVAPEAENERRQREMGGVFGMDLPAGPVLQPLPSPAIGARQGYRNNPAHIAIAQAVTRREAGQRAQAPAIAQVVRALMQRQPQWVNG